MLLEDQVDSSFKSSIDCGNFDFQFVALKTDDNQLTYNNDGSWASVSEEDDVFTLALDTGESEQDLDVTSQTSSTTTFYIKLKESRVETGYAYIEVVVKV